jgi:hypothetical protein
MLIYGNTPRDIMKMMWRRKIKLLSIVAVIALAVMLMGCSVGDKKVNPPLQALDKFWKTLGSGKDVTKETEENSAKVE